MGDSTEDCWSSQLVRFTPSLQSFRHSCQMADRSSINWYQRNYPYAWVGARLVRDLPHVNGTVAI